MGSLAVVIDVELAPIVLAQMQSLALLSQQKRYGFDWLPTTHHRRHRQIHERYTLGTSSFKDIH